MSEPYKFSTGTWYALCSCPDGNHSGVAIYDLFDTVKDAEHSRDEGEHIIRVKREVFITVLSKEAVAA